MTKLCSGCGSVKEVTEFHKKKKDKSGYQPYCKECSKWARNKHYHLNKDMKLGSSF